MLDGILQISINYGTLGNCSMISQKIRNYGGFKFISNFFLNS